MQKQGKNGAIFHNNHTFSAKLVFIQPICVIPLLSNKCTFASEIRIRPNEKDALDICSTTDYGLL